MFRKIYYVLFSQIKLFTFKLKKFNERALQKNSKYGSLKIEELIFVENNEMKVLFEEFFKVFYENANMHNFDMENLVLNKSTMQLFEKKEYVMKFNENLMNPLLKVITKRSNRRALSFFEINKRTI